MNHDSPGKNGRSQQVHDEPSTHVSPVNVHQQQHANIQKQHIANTDGNIIAHQAYQVPHGDAYSANDAGMHNRGAQAANVAAHVAGNNQKAHASNKTQAVDREELARIVAEENESKGKLPKYPGLERWQLIEKMGDGAFSNVYKAQDLTGELKKPVAIKVVRKFEMNSNQVSIGCSEVNISYHLVVYACLRILPTLVLCCRAMLIFTRISRSSQKV